MLAAYATKAAPSDPLSSLEIGERPEPEVPDGWTVIDVKAASLNHHDIWSLRGVGLPEERMPMILGCDAAGLDPNGNEVLVHSVIGSEGWRGDETMDPKRSLLSEIHQGTFAEKVIVPQWNVIPKPEGLSFAEAACLPTAWLTAYRMLFGPGDMKPGETVLIQGASGGVSTAAITLASRAGVRVWVTSRDEGKRQAALDLGADAAFESGARLPERVDVVLETVGEATWSHSLKSCKPGGKVVVSGATSGMNPPGDLARVFFLQLQVLGSTMGSKDELGKLARFCVERGIKPEIDSTVKLADAREGFEKMLAGQMFGKVVIEVG